MDPGSASGSDSSVTFYALGGLWRIQLVRERTVVEAQAEVTPVGRAETQEKGRNAPNSSSSYINSKDGEFG